MNHLKMLIGLVLTVYNEIKSTSGLVSRTMKLLFRRLIRLLRAASLFFARL